MLDCRDYSENELSMIIMNDEFLYNNRFRITEDYLADLGILFTDRQWEVFQEDMVEELEDIG